MQPLLFSWVMSAPAVVCVCRSAPTRVTQQQLQTPRQWLESCRFDVVQPRRAHATSSRDRSVPRDKRHRYKEGHRGLRGDDEVKHRAKNNRLTIIGAGTQLGIASRDLPGPRHSACSIDDGVSKSIWGWNVGSRYRRSQYTDCFILF